MNQKNAINFSAGVMQTQARKQQVTHVSFSHSSENLLESEESVLEKSNPVNKEQVLNKL